MEELRLVRREDRILIVATEAGEEFRLVVDDAVLSELRQLSRREGGPGKVGPREIQSLVRAGKSRAEIAELTGLEEIDIERYEEPVLAERRYILELAQAVAVRTAPAEGAEQQFGVVIAERLIGLGAERAEWSSWRDEEAGWMIGLDFVSHDVSHRAVWSFEHRKNALAPITPDAVTLSKQGDVGDRLIPKLRAVDDLHRNDRFDSDAFDPEQLTAGIDDEADVIDTGNDALFSGPVAPDHPSTGSIPIIDVDAEFERRRTIDERAVKTPEPEIPDLGQTADLLDALRRRRGERGGDEAAESDASEAVNPPVPLHGMVETSDEDAEAPAEEPVEPAIEHPELGTDDENEQPPGPRRGKNRPTIPSWDDILFGTRSEEDPS